MDQAPDDFTETAKAQEAGHTISITANGVPYSHCHNAKVCDNDLGQLGREGSPSTILPIKIDSNENGCCSVVAHAYTGGFSSSGHSAILDTKGNLWLCGCDRWQQLGLGSSQGGSTGYTWKGGRLWQPQFQRNEYVVHLLQSLDPSLGNNNNSKYTSNSLQQPSCYDSSRRWIRDVALGGDHTVILSSNKKDVITFGKGGEGQLGLSSKPWVSSPAKSKLLSSSTADISAVCAFRNCSMTLDSNGDVKSRVGKCSMEMKGMKRALEACQKRAKEIGLNS
ncbi:hypothetical protein ACHAXR_010654 [Thalassiosira sp. AJA248-18]